MADHIFVTGTDTGVGKTTVAGLVGAHWWVRGTRVHVLKPSETGCPAAGDAGVPEFPDRGLEPGALVPLDAFHLARMSGDPRGVDELCPYRFAEPLAPVVAARRAKLRGRAPGEAREPPQLDAISVALMSASQDCDRVLVEGAGGLLVPFGDDFMAIDIAAAHQMPTLVVARLGLGTINHTLLTVRELERRNVPLLGVILNATTPEDTVASRTNRQTLAGYLGEALLGVVPFLRQSPGELGRQDAATLAVQHIDLERLEAAIESHGRD